MLRAVSLDSFVAKRFALMQIIFFCLAKTLASCAILDAVMRKDSETAMRLLGEHIRVSKQERLEEYEDWERETAMRRVMPTIAESADGVH